MHDEFVDNVWLIRTRGFKRVAAWMFVGGA